MSNRQSVPVNTVRGTCENCKKEVDIMLIDGRKYCCECCFVVVNKEHRLPNQKSLFV